MNTALFLSLILLAATPPTITSKPDLSEDVTLVVLYDRSTASRSMFPILKSLQDMGYNIVYANIAKPENAKYLAWFELDTDQGMPCYMMYKGHEAFEKCQGKMSAKALGDWYNRVVDGKPTPKMTKPKAQQEYLGPSEDNQVYLRRRLSPGSCGMLGCMAHGGGVILEYVDAQGNVVGRSQ